jgi:hypothetical protein
VSEHLPDWIDLHFGVKTLCLEQYNVFSPILLETVWNDASRLEKLEFAEQLLKTAGQLPQQLFAVMHPSRTDENFDAILIKDLISSFIFVESTELDDITITCCAMLDCAISAIRIGFVNQFGAIYRYEMSQGGFHKKLMRSEKWPNCLSTSCNGGFVLIEPDSGNGITVTTDIDTFDLSIQSISLICSCDDVICIGNELGNFVWWFVDDLISNEILFVLDRVECCAISQSYGIVVFATSAGFAYICDLESHQISFRASLQGRIGKRMLISEGFGFILVNCFDGTLWLFSVNGEFIRSIEFGKEICSWKCFKDKTGFDFLVVSDWNGNLMMCELFYLNFGEVFYRANGNVALIEYDTATESLIVVAQDPLRVIVLTKTTVERAPLEASSE